MATVAVALNSFSYAQALAAAISDEPGLSTIAFASIPDFVGSLALDRPDLAVVEVGDADAELVRLLDEVTDLALILVGGDRPPNVAEHRPFVSWKLAVADLVWTIRKTLRSNGHIDVEARLARLSPRETEMLVLLLSGFSRSEIASRLYVSANTVRTHIGHIRTKLGVRSQAEAVSVAWAAGLRPRIRQTAGCS